MNPLMLPTDVRRSTLAERQAAGVAARSTRPRTSFANWTPPSDRPDPIAQLADQEVVRLQALLPLRHERMSVSPFTFYRGSAAVMASDLGSMLNTGITVQLCGDAHLSNFGLFAGQDRSVIFDVNDFDETNPGPFEWDVMRLAASFMLAAQDNSFTEQEANDITRLAASSYRVAMAEYAGMSDLAIWYDRISTATLEQWAAQVGGDKGTKQINKVIGKAQSRDGWSAITKLTEVVDGKRQFLDQPPVLVRITDGDDLHPWLDTLMDKYRSELQSDRRELIRRYQVVDFGHKVVGVGSVGLRAFVLLLQGRDENDLLVLQAKEAVQSVLEPYTKSCVYEHQGQRVVEGQRLMQAASDAFLGWVQAPNGRQFYVRQLRDMKWSPDIAKLPAPLLAGYAALCGRTLAHGHARSGDPVEIAAYLGQSEKFDVAISEFARVYSAQVNSDFAQYTAAIADGRVVTGHAVVSGDHIIERRQQVVD
jgi:uncharacterized protein (DUF2252 family)